MSWRYHPNTALPLLNNPTEEINQCKTWWVITKSMRYSQRWALCPQKLAMGLLLKGTDRPSSVRSLIQHRVTHRSQQSGQSPLQNKVTHSSKRQNHHCKCPHSLRKTQLSNDLLTGFTAPRAGWLRCLGEVRTCLYAASWASVSTSPSIAWRAATALLNQRFNLKIMLKVVVYA